MKRKSKIIIGVIAAILIVLLGLMFWDYTSGQSITWTTPTGEERGIAMPKIPGMKIISEEKGDCTYKADYIYELYKEKDLSDYIKDSLKDTFLKKDWKLKDERIENGVHTLDFYTEKVGVVEVMHIKIGFEQGKGTLFSLDYRWPPCLEDEK